MTSLLLSCPLLFCAQVAPKGFEANWESLDARPVPSWFMDAKLGIFIHWGVYSVPSFGKKGTYAEWYWDAMQNKKGETWAFHERVYGADFAYQDFASRFKAELFDASEWAQLFADAGAKYVVLTSKHHDGFCLWPSDEANRSWGRSWNSASIGPKRDLLGELSQAVREQGLRMGLYYSLYEWFNPLYLKDFERFRDEHFFPQFKDVVKRYRPSTIFTDGEWSHPSEEWRSPELLAWLFNESGAGEDVAINDRWGKECRSQHGGYFTTEYGEVGAGKELKEGRYWEENRSLGASFGYNRNENVGEYLSSEAVIHLLVETVSKGGNLCLNVGPREDGKIPPIMEERLRDLGRWLKINGEAIYGTRPWRVVSEGDHIKYTSKDDCVYAICLKWPGETLFLEEPKSTKKTRVQLLGWDGEISAERGRDTPVVTLKGMCPTACASSHAFVFKLEGVK